MVLARSLAAPHRSVLESWNLDVPPSGCTSEAASTAHNHQLFCQRTNPVHSHGFQEEDEPCHRPPDPEIDLCHKQTRSEVRDSIHLWRWPFAMAAHFWIGSFLWWTAGLVDLIYQPLRLSRSSTSSSGSSKRRASRCRSTTAKVRVFAPSIPGLKID